MRKRNLLIGFILAFLAMGLEVTMKKSLSRQEIAERELRKREAKKKKENSE